MSTNCRFESSLEGARLPDGMRSDTKITTREAGERVADSALRREVTLMKLAQGVFAILGLGCFACGGDPQPLEPERDVAYSFFGSTSPYTSSQGTTTSSLRRPNPSYPAPDLPIPSPRTLLEERPTTTGATG